MMREIKHIIIIYDEECILCRHFRAFTNLRKKIDITRYDMHTNTKLVDNYYKKGYDINQGMIIDIDSIVYHGAMALTIFDTILIPHHQWQKILLHTIKYKCVAYMIYPILLLIRKILSGIQER